MKKLIKTADIGSLKDYEVVEALMERGYGKEMSEGYNARKLLKDDCQFVSLLADSIYRKNSSLGSKIRTTEDTCAVAFLVILARVMGLQR